ncbi:MAG: hypothetical protein KGI71_05760 [Patescibacteria group bacterium]|nr:hypothetical protein [Patescibacteria group bacterium]
MGGKRARNSDIVALRARVKEAEQLYQGLLSSLKVYRRSLRDQVLFAQVQLQAGNLVELRKSLEALDRATAITTEVD